MPAQDIGVMNRDLLRNTRLSDIIELNTGITSLQPDVFISNVPEPTTLVMVSGLIGTLARARNGRRRRSCRK